MWFLEKGDKEVCEWGVISESNKQSNSWVCPDPFQASCLWCLRTSYVQFLEPSLKQAFVPRVYHRTDGQHIPGDRLAKPGVLRLCWTQPPLLNSIKWPQGTLPVSPEPQPAFHFLSLHSRTLTFLCGLGCPTPALLLDGTDGFLSAKAVIWGPVEQFNGANPAPLCCPDLISHQGGQRNF